MFKNETSIWLFFAVLVCIAVEQYSFSCPLVEHYGQWCIKSLIIEQIEIMFAKAKTTRKKGEKNEGGWREGDTYDCLVIIMFVKHMEYVLFVFKKIKNYGSVQQPTG